MNEPSFKYLASLHLSRVNDLLAFVCGVSLAGVLGLGTDNQTSNLVYHVLLLVTHITRETLWQLERTCIKFLLSRSGTPGTLQEAAEIMYREDAIVKSYD